MSDLKELIESRNQVAANMRALHEASEAEGAAFTPEQRESWDAMDADLTSHDTRIEIAKCAKAIEDVELPVYKLPVQADNPEELRNYNPDAQPGQVTHKDAWDSWARRGISGCTNAEQSVLSEHRAQSVGTGSEGGYTVPTDMSNRIIERMKAFSGITNVCNILTTSSGNPIDFPGNDDTGNPGVLLAENTAASEEDLVFTTKQLSAYAFSSNIVRVSKQLLQDNEVDLESYLVNALGKRLGRAEAQYFATGTGSAQPEGLMVGATVTATAAGIAAITFADVLAVEHSIDPAYREGGVGTYVFNDQTFRLIKGLMDGEGRPLFIPAMSQSAPDTILGRRFQIDQGIADVAADARSIAFGDMSAFTVRRALGVSMMRLEERYAEYLQVGFLGWSRSDSALLDTGAVGVLVHPSS